MTIDSTVAVLYGARDLRIEKRKLLPPGLGEVQVKVLATTLCGSDAHYYTHGRNGSFFVQHPHILGHESSGTIISIGDDVKNLKVGQNVALEVGLMCRNCKWCTEGRYNLCPNMKFKSSAKISPHTDGTLQYALNIPSFLVHPIPPTLTLEKAALAEPLSVVLHAFHRCSPLPSSSILIFGAGPIGLLTAALAKSLGSSFVCLVDIDSNRLELGTKQGWASHSFTLERVKATNGGRYEQSEERLKQSEETAKKVLNHFNLPQGFDVTFECAGVESCIQAAIYSTKSGGKVVLIGMGTPIVTMPIAAAALREVDIIGVFRYANTYPTALQLLAAPFPSPLSNIDQLISHRLPLEQSKQAFELLANGKDETGQMVLKVLVTGPSDL